MRDKTYRGDNFAQPIGSMRLGVLLNGARFAEKIPVCPPGTHVTVKVVLRGGPVCGHALAAKLQDLGWNVDEPGLMDLFVKIGFRA